MTLNNEAVTRFQKLYRLKCGILLAYDDAHSKAVTELQRFRLIYRHIPAKSKSGINRFHSKSNGNSIKCDRTQQKRR